MVVKSLPPEIGGIPTFLRLLAAAALCFVAAACATREPFPPDLRGGEVEPVAAILADAYKQASETYLYEVKVSDLALAGLSDLSHVHGSLEVTSEGDTVIVKLFDEELLHFARPAEMDVDGWSEQIAASMIALADRTGTPSVPPRRLFELHMEGVAKALGPEVEYISHDAFWEWLRRQPDSTVDFSFRRVDEGLQVVDLDSEGRLEAGGLRIGDVVTAVDHADVKTMKPFNLFQRLTGREGSSVTLSVLRDDSPQPTYLPLTRWKPEPPALQLERHGGIAEFAFPVLTKRLNDEFWKAMRYEFRKDKFDDQPLTGFLLDLRGASNTSFGAAIAFSEAFLWEGVKVVERGRNSSSERVWKAGVRDDSDRLPLVVLIDGMSGPGVEVVAAALQDNGRAILIGSSTIGGGVHNRTLTLPEKNSYWNLGYLSMPATWIYAASGYGIEGRGVMPDICIVEDEQSVESWLAALRRGEGLVDLADRTRHIDPNDETTLAAHRAVCPLDPDIMTFDLTVQHSSGDDVARWLALAILNDPELYKRLLRPSPGLKNPG